MLRVQQIGIAFSARRRSDLPGAACLVSGADRCSVSSVRACASCCVRSALHLARPVLLPVLCSPSGCAGAVVSTGGVYRERQGWGRSCPLIPKQIKKAFPLHTHPTFTNPNPFDCASLQKFRKIQKDPSRSLDCAIIS